MIAPDYGFTIKNYVGSYKMIEKGADVYIVSNEFYNAHNEEKEIHIKELYMDDYKNNDYLIVALANINVNNDDEILEFCNKYGLPYSSIIIYKKNGCNILGLDFRKEVYKESTEFYRQDNMKRSEFCKYVISAKHFLSLKNELESENPNMQNMICDLLYLLLFERLWGFNFDDDDAERVTSTAEFRYLFQKSLIETNFEYAHDISMEIVIAEVISIPVFKSNDKPIYNYIKKSNLLQNNITYCKKMLEFLCNILIMCIEERKDKPIILVDSNYHVFINDDFKITYKLKQLIFEIAQVILSDSISEGLSNVHPILTVNNNKISSDWKFEYQYEGVYLELLLMCSAGNQVRKCWNSSCGNFFYAETRYNKMYCSHECAVAAAKRRQRIRDKENPNRPRLKPGFKGRKKSKNRCSILANSIVPLISSKLFQCSM